MPTTYTDASLNTRESSGALSLTIQHQIDAILNTRETGSTLTTLSLASDGAQSSETVSSQQMQVFSETLLSPSDANVMQYIAQTFAETPLAPLEAIVAESEGGILLVEPTLSPSDTGTATLTQSFSDNATASDQSAPTQVVFVEWQYTLDDSANPSESSTAVLTQSGSESASPSESAPSSTLAQTFGDTANASDQMAPTQVVSVEWQYTLDDSANPSENVGASSLIQTFGDTLTCVENVSQVTLTLATSESITTNSDSVASSVFIQSFGDIALPSELAVLGANAPVVLSEPGLSLVENTASTLVYAAGSENATPSENATRFIISAVEAELNTQEDKPTSVLSASAVEAASLSESGTLILIFTDSASASESVLVSLAALLPSENVSPSDTATYNAPTAITTQVEAALNTREAPASAVVSGIAQESAVNPSESITYNGTTTPQAQRYVDALLNTRDTAQYLAPVVIATRADALLNVTDTAMFLPGGVPSGTRFYELMLVATESMSAATLSGTLLESLLDVFDTATNVTPKPIQVIEAALNVSERVSSLLVATSSDAIIGSSDTATNITPQGIVFVESASVSENVVSILTQQWVESASIGEGATSLFASLASVETATTSETSILLPATPIGSLIDATFALDLLGGSIVTASMLELATQSSEALVSSVIAVMSSENALVPSDGSVQTVGTRDYVTGVFTFRDRGIGSSPSGGTTHHNELSPWYVGQTYPLWLLVARTTRDRAVDLTTVENVQLVIHAMTKGSVDTYGKGTFRTLNTRQGILSYQVDPNDFIQSGTVQLELVFVMSNGLINKSDPITVGIVQE